MHSFIDWCIIGNENMPKPGRSF